MCTQSPALVSNAADSTIDKAFGLRGCAMLSMVQACNLRMRCATVAGKVGIWDTSTGQCKHMLEGPGGAIEWAQWHPKGDVILAGSDDFTAWLWNAQTGTCMQVRCIFDLTSTCLKGRLPREAYNTACYGAGKPGRTKQSCGVAMALTKECETCL